MKINNEIIGWISAVLFACCGIPEVLIALKTGDSGLSWWFLGMWFWGEVLAIIYVLGKSHAIKLWPLFFNYGLNILCLIVIALCKGF